MSGRSVLFVQGAVLLAAFLLVVPQALAGPHVVAGKPPPRSQPAPAPAPAVRPVAMSVVVTVPAQPTTEPVYVDIRGPDGQVRSYEVEGGREAIQYRQVVVRPGGSVTIRLVAR